MLNTHTAVLVVLVAVCVGCGHKQPAEPTEEQARIALELFIKESGQGCNIVEFLKTNGVPSVKYGVRYYRMDFSGEIERPPERVPSMPFGGKYLLLRKPFTAGSVELEKTAAGWKAIHWTGKE